MSREMKGTYFTCFASASTQQTSRNSHICNSVATPAIGTCSTLIHGAKVDELLGETGGAATTVYLVGVGSLVVCESAAGGCGV